MLFTKNHVFLIFTNLFAKAKMYYYFLKLGQMCSDLLFLGQKPNSHQGTLSAAGCCVVELDLWRYRVKKDVR